MSDTTPYTLLKLNDKTGTAQANSILSQTFFNDGNINVTCFHFAQGQALSEHSSSKAATLHILRGHALLGLGDDRLDAHEGTWVHMPAQLPHSVTAISDVTLLLTLFTSSTEVTPSQTHG